MTSLHKILLGVAMGAGVLAVSLVGASAAVVCSGDVCWHSRATYDYPGDARVVVHPDDWHWGPTEHFTFREHEGRGYWHGGQWRDW